MKGPFERLKYDLRRVFECPECHHKERVDSTKTTAVCRCQATKPILEQVVMKLVEDRVQRRFPVFVPPVEVEPAVVESTPVEKQEPESQSAEVPALPEEAPKADQPKDA